MNEFYRRELTKILFQLSCETLDTVKESLSNNSTDWSEGIPLKICAYITYDQEEVIFEFMKDDPEDPIIWAIRLLSVKDDLPPVKSVTT